MPFDKIPALIQSMTGNASTGAPNPQLAALSSMQNAYPGQQPWGAPAPRPDEGRDAGFQDGVKSPARYGRGDPVRPIVGGIREAHLAAAGTDRTMVAILLRAVARMIVTAAVREGRITASVAPRRRYGQSPSPPDDLPTMEKWVEFDPTLPSGSIKVLSRTLFVGGVT